MSHECMHGVSERGHQGVKKEEGCVSMIWYISAVAKTVLCTLQNGLEAGTPRHLSNEVRVGARSTENHEIKGVRQRCFTLRASNLARTASKPVKGADIVGCGRHCVMWTTHVGHK